MDKLYESSASEAAVKKFWQENNIYRFDKEAGEVYSIDTPPPTVSGTLHIGHVFSYTQTDLIARYKRMRGFSVYYPMGFDDNGLPTERFVEKKNGIKGHLMGRSEFIALCIQETEKVEQLFEDLWRRIGLSIDWENVYSTISGEVRKISQLSFLELYKNGKAFRQAEPSLYCTTCRTSVAQAELDSAQLPSKFNDLIFKTSDGKDIIVATTRPELLPACVALFYHPDDMRYAHLNGQNAITPFFNKSVPVISDDKVDPEKGSGLVMCCTFGDQTDIYWYKKHKLAFEAVIGLDGKWTSLAGPLEGLNARDARAKIIELLNEQKLVADQRKITHHVNVHERCKQEIEFVVLWQWFINILDHKEIFLDLADKITWKPAYMKARYHDWVSNISWNWCISRQRFFGIPFPVWHCNVCDEVLCAPIESLPLDPQEVSFPGGKCTSCNAHDIRPDTDVMDTWNTSSLTPQINAGWPDHQDSGVTLPMSLRPQAHDIIRTWAFDTIVKSYFHHNDIPWNDIVISGHVLAGKEKISKSKENSKMSPESLLDSYPADVIRYWTASAALGVDTAFSENQLRIGQRLITKLWNAFRFSHEFVSGFDKKEPRPDLTGMNAWVMHQLFEVLEQYEKSFDDYDYSGALERVERFFWHVWCDNYLEVIKDQLFKPEKYSTQEIEATRYVLYEVGFALLQLFAPFVPFVTEQLYQLLYRSKEEVVSLHITRLNNERYFYSNEASFLLGQHVLHIVSGVRKLKSEHRLSLKSSLTNLVIHADKELSYNLKHLIPLITGVTHAQEVTFAYDVITEDFMVLEPECIAHIQLGK